VPVHSGTHLYARSDLVCHGTSDPHVALRRPSTFETGEDIPEGEPLLLGFAMYTRREVIAAGLLLWPGAHPQGVCQGVAHVACDR
jgi:hypothetical protein